MRQWVESEPCGQLELCLGAFPLPPVSTLVPLPMAPSLQTEVCLGSITVLLQYGALARAPALLSLSLEPGKARTYGLTQDFLRCRGPRRIVRGPRALLGARQTVRKPFSPFVNHREPF